MTNEEKASQARSNPSGIVNDLAEGQVKAVKLPDGTYITEKLAKSMTKAQAAAFRAFPGQPFIHDRCVFRMGYEQAEKDTIEQAMECELVCLKDRLLAVLPIKEFQWTAGDKIKIIIVKEDEK